MRQGDEIVYVERAYSERSGMQVVRAIGGHAPLHLTSNGAQLQETHAQPIAARFGAVDEAADGQVVENAVRGGGVQAGALADLL